MHIPKIAAPWIIVILSCALSANAASGQTALVRGPATAAAHIPYDFWIGGTRLPAGDYSVSPGAPSVVVFWNEKVAIGEQAFLIPTGNSVANGHFKLIFVLRDGKHYLREIWYSEGQAVLTSAFDFPRTARDRETEIKLLEQKHDNTIVQTRQ